MKQWWHGPHRNNDLFYGGLGVAFIVAWYIGLK